eukprot:COSAG02_NODE_5386_length_4374_cov_6.152047_1_plen_1041_part_00
MDDESGQVNGGRLAVDRAEVQRELALSRSETELAELRKCLDDAARLWAGLRASMPGGAVGEGNDARSLAEALAAAASWVSLLEKNLDVLSGRAVAEDATEPDSSCADTGGDTAISEVSSDLAWGRPRTRKPPEAEEDAAIGPAADNADPEQGTGAVVTPAPDAPVALDETMPVLSDDDDDIAVQDGAVRAGDLEVVEYLGKGAVGMVYLVRQVSTGKLSAVKALSKRKMLQKKKGVAHVMQELNILRSCAHPFVIKLDASFQTKHWLCHMMEFCPRGHFYSLLQAQDKKRLPEDSARFYAAEILSGIEYLHINGFIYRDMKPENILVAESGHLRLTDFDLSQTADAHATPITADDNGIGVSQKEHDRLMRLSEKHETRARDAAEQEVAVQHRTNASTDAPSAASTAKQADCVVVAGSASSLTGKCAGAKGSEMAPARFDSFVGTIEYMAPEVVHGTGHSFAVDFWVFGVMVYEMLYGVTPFRGQDAKATFEDITQKQTRSANFFKHPLCEDPKPKVSSAVKDLIAKLLVKDEKKRLGYAHGVAQIKAHAWFKDVKWDLQRNQEPPIIPESKFVSLTNLQKFEEVFDKLDKEEKDKIQAAAEKRAAKRAEEGKDAGGSPEIDRSGANNPARLRGFQYERELVQGSDPACGAYGNDQTGRNKLIQGMAAEAQRRADAQRFEFTVPLPLPAASDVDGCEPIAAASTELVRIAGLVFKSSVSPVVVDVVRNSTAAAESRLQHALMESRTVRLVRINDQAVDSESWFECLTRAVGSTVQQAVQLQFETDECPNAAAGGANSKQSGVDSRTSIAWNSSRSLQDERLTHSGTPGTALQVTVPENVQPGQQILVLGPSGQRCKVTVPDAADPGTVFQVVVPSALSAGEAASNSPSGGSQSEPKRADNSDTRMHASFAEALAALQAGEYAAAVSHFETVLAREECEPGQHDEARQGLAQAERGVTLSGLGNEQLQKILDGDGCYAVHEHLGLEVVEMDLEREGRAGTGEQSRPASQPRSPSPAAGLRSWLPTARKSWRKGGETTTSDHA